MKSKRALFVLIILGLLCYFYLKSNATSQLSQVKQVVQSPTQSPSPTPTLTLVQFHYDKTTDLKTELNSINPQVNDSSFTDLKKLVSSL